MQRSVAAHEDRDRKVDLAIKEAEAEMLERESRLRARLTQSLKENEEEKRRRRNAEEEVSIV